MALPKKVKFGFRKLAVEYTDTISKDRDHHSQALYRESKMEIQSTLPLSAQARHIFCCVHAFIEDVAETDLSAADLRRLRNALFAVLRDNPILARAPSPDDVKELRLFGIRFKVEEMEHHHPLDGYAWGDVGSIGVNACGTPEHRAHVLLHEVYHQVYNFLCYKQDEAGVETMSWLLCMVLRENDFSWVTEHDALGSTPSVIL